MTSTLWYQKVAALMARRGMTQTELAARIGLGQSAVSMLLSGQRNPRMDTLKAIADAMGVSVAELVSEDHRFVDDPEKKALLDLWDRIDADQRATVLAMIEAALIRRR